MSRSRSKQRFRNSVLEGISGLTAWELGFPQWLTHGFRKNGADLNRRAALTLLLIFVVVWLVMASYLVLVSQTLVTARHVQGLRDELDRLYKENAALEQQIAARQAVSELLRQAESLGFSPATKIEFVEARD